MPRIVRDIQLLVNDNDDHLYGYRLSDGTEVRIGTSRPDNAAAVVEAAGRGNSVARTVIPSGVDDHLKIINAMDGYTGTIILGRGNFDIAGRVPMKPFVYLRGAGINATVLTPRAGSGLTMFGFDEDDYADTTNRQSWGIADCTFYGYGNDSVAINTKLDTYAMQDVVIDRVYFDGFSAGTPGSANHVVRIADPWGLRMFNSIIEQTGSRPAMIVQANGTSADGAMLSMNKIKNNNGNNLELLNLETCQIIGNEMYTNAAAGYNIICSGCVANIISLNKIRFGGGHAIALINTSLGNVLTGNVCQGDGVSSLTGITMDASSVSNSVVGGSAFNYTSANLSEGTPASNRFVGVFSGAGFTDAP